MSSSFVKDPRDIVKPGDIVRVKVLDVDVARKRIALTLRLDDEPEPRPARGAGPAGGRAAGGRAAGGTAAAGRAADESGTRRSRVPRPGSPGNRPARTDRAAPANTALADALRRAGLTDT
jgi:uncharacterized protein